MSAATPRRILAQTQQRHWATGASRRRGLRLKGVVARLRHRVCLLVALAKLGQPFYGPANRQFARTVTYRR